MFEVFFCNLLAHLLASVTRQEGSDRGSTNGLAKFSTSLRRKRDWTSLRFFQVFYSRLTEHLAILDYFPQDFQKLIQKLYVLKALHALDYNKNLLFHNLIYKQITMKSSRRSSGANEAMFKLIMIGDSGTGKSCLLVRYVKDQFNQQYNVTVGVQFASKTLKIDQNYRVKLQIWDTAGQESFRSIVKSFYRNSSAVILVYNITKRKTFGSLASWIAEAKENSPKNAIFVLIGTHLDMQNERQVTKEQAETWMKQQEITMFFQTSAKTSQNVAKAFEEVAKQLFYTSLNKRRGSSAMNINTSQINQNQLILTDKKKEDSGKCC